MIQYKIDILEELQNRGFDQARLRKEKLLPSQTITNIKEGKGISLETLNRICVMLRMQPGDVLEVKVTDEEKVKFF